jgi:hypothetical protein
MPDYRVTHSRPAPLTEEGESQGDQSLGWSGRAKDPAAAIEKSYEQWGESIENDYTVTVIEIDADGDEIDVTPS